jgi:ankyrin repeat protein
MNKENLNSLLMESSKKGEIEKCRDLIKNGADVNYCDKNWTILQYATIREQIELIKILLENGADVNYKEKNGYNTALHIVADNGIATTAKLLIENGANIEAKDFFGCTPLHISASNNHSDVTSVLIKAGANIFAKDSYNNTPLHLAIKSNNNAVLKILISHYSTPELKIVINDMKTNIFDKKEKDITSNKAIISIIQKEIDRREQIKSEIKAVKKAMDVPDLEF